MKLTTSLFITAMLLSLVSEIQSQDLEISQGDKTKIFKTLNFIRLDLPGTSPVTCKSCPRNYVVGRLISYKNDTLRLQMRYENQSISGNGKAIGTQSKNYDEKLANDWPVVDVPKKEIMGITKQGVKYWHPLNSGDIVGGFLIFGGTVSGLSALAADNEDNEDALKETTLVLLVSGTATALIFNRKTYHTEYDTNPKWKDRRWNIK